MQDWTPSARNIVEWLDRAALAHGGRPAVQEADGRCFSYGEMQALSRAAQRRLAAAGVRPGDRVGVYMRKSAHGIVACQGALRAGAAYVPLDPFAPASRAAAMIHDCQAGAVVADEDLAPALARQLDALGSTAAVLAAAGAPDPVSWSGTAVADRAAPRERQVADDCAFMLYTSGSTGTPKAVVLTHANVVGFTDWCSTAFEPREQDKLAMHAPLHFSLSVFNLYVAWKHGGAVVLIDERTARIPEAIGPLIERLGVTIWFSTPTILSLLADSGRLADLQLPSLRLVMFAGEPFPRAAFSHLRAQLPHPRYVHVLGSTETHIMACYEVPVGLAGDETAPLPIGNVCPHLRFRIVDGLGLDAPPEDDGELWLSGPAITPGYWNAPADNARAFVTDAAGTTWYRTGDIVRVRRDGTLDYRGRRDRMVKKRGNRIELAEIEHCLWKHRGVREAAVVAVADERGGLQVKAVVVVRQEERPSTIELKAHCAQTLPLYMVPDVIEFAPALPRNANGKVDFAVLGQGG